MLKNHHGQKSNTIIKVESVLIIREKIVYTLEQNAIKVEQRQKSKDLIIRIFLVSVAKIN